MSCTFVLLLNSAYISHFKVEGMGHNDSGGSEKKSSESANDIQTFNAENLQSNMKVIYYRFVSTT